MRGYAGPDGAVPVVAEKSSRSSTMCGEGAVEEWRCGPKQAQKMGKAGNRMAMLMSTSTPKGDVA